MNRPYRALVPSPTERSPSSPHPARTSRSSPAPARGGDSHGDIRWAAAPGGGADAGFPKDREESARENQLETDSSPGSPRAVDRGGNRLWGVGAGEGARPLPAGAYPYVPHQSPCPPRGGVVRGDTGMQTPESVKKGRYSPPLSVPVIENRCTSAQFLANMRQNPLNHVDIRSQGTVGICSFGENRSGSHRLPADQPRVPQNGLCLLNWTVSSRVSIPNVSADSGRPSPAFTRPS